MMTFGRVVARVQTIDKVKTRLGRFCLTKLGCSGKTTYVMTMYMLHNKDNVDTKRQTARDQLKMY